MSIQDWQIARVAHQQDRIQMHPLGRGDRFIVRRNTWLPLESILHALCDELIREREAFAPAPDAPAPVPYETIASDVEALVVQHMMLVDRFAVLHRAGLDSPSAHAHRLIAQARLDVADSVRRIRGLT